jgi:preprotein translocase subunit SecY
MPYITASIILQLLTVVYEPLAKLQKEGELGRKKITQWTRYITVILSAVQSFGIAIGLEKGGLRAQSRRWGFILMTMLTLTTGSAFIMWLGEQITERGIGNGMSLLIFCRHCGRVAARRADLIDKAKNRPGAPSRPADGVAGHLHGRGGGVHRLCGTQRAPHSGAVRQARGRTQSDGRAVHAPSAARERRRRDAGDLRVFHSDFAADGRATACATTVILAIFRTGWVGRAALHVAVRRGHYFLRLLLCVDRVQPERSCRQHAEVWRIYSRHSPGKRTADHINEVLTRITLVGALYLIIISFIPEWMITGIHLNHLPFWLGDAF